MRIHHKCDCTIVRKTSAFLGEQGIFLLNGTFDTTPPSAHKTLEPLPTYTPAVAALVPPKTSVQNAPAGVTCCAQKHQIHVSPRTVSSPLEHRTKLNPVDRDPNFPEDPNSIRLNVKRIRARFDPASKNIRYLSSLVWRTYFSVLIVQAGLALRSAARNSR